MIVSEFDPRHGHCSLTIESSDDLWTLRRLIARGDVVVTRSSRVVKKEDEYSRPDKGERVKVTLALSVEEVHLDSSIERIRLRGSIVEASDDSVNRSGSHAVTLSPGHSLTLRKEHWSQVDVRLVRPPAGESKRFVLLAADRREAGLGTLAGSHLTVVTSVESGLGGKQGDEQSASPYLRKLADLVALTAREEDEVVVAGPGNFKNAIVNQIRERTKSLAIVAVEGFDLTGTDGVRALIRFKGFQELARGSRLVDMQKLVDEAIRRISSGDQKVAYSLPRVAQAAVSGAVESCAVSDDVFSAGLDEEEVVSVLNEVESKGGTVYLADSSLEFGKQVSSFGGILALLRYQLRPY
ncbi:MAG TPA: hypothetical protein VEB67_00410 [Nitrososphaerales archaeon]|nr:hypothetical protein [Nitrososphaerales archaeon]